MKLSVKILIVSLLVLGVLLSCNESKVNLDARQTPIVSVGDNVLYQSQLDSMMPLNYLKADSVRLADMYIQNWIRNILVYEQAKKNISNQRMIDEMVEDYRRTLVIHSYQEDLIASKAVDKVNEAKLTEFYEKNKEQFRLQSPIIKGLYLKVPKESPEVNNFRRWYSTGKDHEIENIEKYALQHTVGYELFYNKWVDFGNIMAMMPLNLSDKEQFLKQNSKVEVSDSSFVYLLHIKEYKLTGDIAPYDYIVEDIKKAIIGQERNQFLKQIEEDLYNRAELNKTIKFYNK